MLLRLTADGISDQGLVSLPCRTKYLLLASVCMVRPPCCPYSEDGGLRIGSILNPPPTSGTEPIHTKSFRYGRSRFTCDAYGVPISPLDHAFRGYPVIPGVHPECLAPEPFGAGIMSLCAFWRAFRLTSRISNNVS